MPHFLKTIILSVFLTVAISFQKGKTLDCEAYKKGKFSRFIYNNSGLGHWTRQEIFIERNDTIQTEIVQMFPNDTFFYSINWTMPCKYELRFIRATNSFADSFNRYYTKPGKLKYQIRNGTDKYYIEKNRNKLDTTWAR